MNTSKRSVFKTTVLFSIAVFTILLTTMIVISLVTLFLIRINALPMGNPFLLLVCFALISITIGTVLSAIVGRRFLSPIIEISRATKEVAKGDFSIVIDEDMRAEETRAMAHNFNIMTKELAHTELLRNDFVENVSHEFKTPLSAVEGYAELLQKPGLEEEKRIEYTGRILHNTKRLTTLIGNILMLSRLEHQETEIKKEAFSLDEQIRETILMYEEGWSAKNLELDIDLEPCDYNGNNELMAQVWQNLIGNAVKFSKDSGFIRVILRKDTSAVTISVSDNGIGIDSEAVKRIFEKFYQSDISHSTEGNGLGLTLAKRIIDLHNGTITVSSKKDKGTTFTVTLPMR